MLQPSVDLCHSLNLWYGQEQKKDTREWLRPLWVEGPPGTGKSSTVYLWLLSQRSKDPDFTFAWLHIHRTQTTLLWGGQMFYNMTMAFEHMKTLSTTKTGAGRFRACSVFVCDGVTRDLADHATTMCSGFTVDEVPTVFVTSQQVKFDDKEDTACVHCFYPHGVTMSSLQGSAGTRTGQKAFDQTPARLQRMCDSCLA